MIEVRTNGELVKVIESDPIPAAVSAVRFDVENHIHARLDELCESLGWRPCHWRNL